jgi:hypothetical protein
MILMLKFKPKQSKILMISRKKVFRVFDRPPDTFAPERICGGESPRDGLPNGV